MVFTDYVRQIMFRVDSPMPKEISAQSSTVYSFSGYYLPSHYMDLSPGYILPNAIRSHAIPPAEIQLQLQMPRCSP